MRFGSVEAWLKWQETLNPRGIILGLERCLPVARALHLLPLPFPVIIVGGTNGKGSCVAMLDAILSRAGYRVGAYTSPHLRSFNETVRVAGEAASDRALISAFETVADARGDVALTWFEFRTLAAALILRDAGPDVALLEVGLGGRLDAVNMFDPDVALVSSIELDHMDWLGEDRDAIGKEKAGILRPGRPGVCADPAPPRGFLDAARKAGARLFLAGVDYRFEQQEMGWRWSGPESSLSGLPPPGIAGPCQLRNAAAVLMVLALVADRFPLDARAIEAGIAGCRLAGRQEVVPGPPEMVLDVAHNPEAARALAAALDRRPSTGRTRAVFAMYADKDIAGVAGALGKRVDEWHAAGLPPPRGAPAAIVAEALGRAGVAGGVILHAEVADAMRAARRASALNDRIIVFGSFETVRRVVALESS